jgi:polyhydroxyalkanoate synthesis regulator phasin
MFGDFVQKAVYMGLGLASYAGEKAGETLADLQGRVQKLADELVERGEISAEEARRMVDEAVAKARMAAPNGPGPGETGPSTGGPRPIEIEILEDDDTGAATGATAEASVPPDELERMRQQVRELEDELRRIQRP